MRQHAARVPNQRGKQPVFDRRQVHGRTRTRDLAQTEIDDYVAEFHQGRFTRRRLIATPQMRANPRHQFRYAKRLGQIVVGARIQRRDLLLFLRTRRQHDHRQFGPASQFADHIETVGIRQTKIDNDEVRLARGRLHQPLLARFRLVHGNALGLERRAHKAANLLFVLDQHNSEVRFAHGVLESDGGKSTKSCSASSEKLGTGGAASTGKVNQKRAPWTCGSGRLSSSRLFAPIVPPCACTIARQIESPSPMPGFADSFSPRVNFSNTRSSMFAGKPGPLSSIYTRTNGLPFASVLSAPMTSFDPGGVYFAAFSSRFEKSRSISTASSCRNGRSAGKRTSTGRPLNTRRHARSAAPTVSSRSDHCRFSRRPPACKRAMSSKFVTMLVMRSDSSWIAAINSALAGERVSPRASASMDANPTMVVSGVRKSCEIADSSELRRRSDSMLTSASRAIST